MNRDEYMALQSEIKELRNLLAGIPIESVIERASLEARLGQAELMIAGWSAGCMVLP